MDASMGPRSIDRGIALDNGPHRACTLVLQWGRDLSIAELTENLIFGFGAETLQWGRDLSIAEFVDVAAGTTDVGTLQWGRDLSIAELSADVLLSAQGFRFNGAAIYRSRNSRGTLPARAGALPRFNGAAIYRSRNSAKSRQNLTLSKRFNGAAIYRSRNSFGIVTRVCDEIRLQWGRDLSIAELRALGKTSFGR